MEESSSEPQVAAGEITEFEYLKRHGPSPHPQKLYLDKHAAPSADFDTDDCCSGEGNWVMRENALVFYQKGMIDSAGEIEVDCLYEVDHEKLPPNSPVQLKAIRIVMVADKTMHNVSVRYPSKLSLRGYFDEGSEDKNSRKVVGQTSPQLDELFVMGGNVADKVLRRPVPSTEFAQQKHLNSFWLVSPKSAFLNRDELLSHPSVRNRLLGVCVPELKSPEMLRWGVRRKVRFIGRHLEKPLCSGLKGMEFIEKKRVAKRILESPGEHDRKRKTARREKVTTSSKDRWSKERYEAAELKLMDIMREKGAVLGNPILRPELRAEARKHIGDTGLLDHLLKHMAGKVVPDRDERFRRRHNPDGAMEYWLERADLVEIRRQAGVKDPYWAPPPGWQPGDGPLLDPACAKEFKQLREEMANMKRDFEEQLLKRKQENEVEAAPTCNKDTPLDVGSVSSMQERTLDNLLKRKTQLEQQLKEISNSLNAMQGELRQLSEGAITKEVGKMKEEKPCKEVRSGFRICKPQGTFLWPNSGGSMSAQVPWQVEDFLAVPTPTSASSGTPSLPPSPVGARPKIRTVTVSCVRSDSLPADSVNCTNSWKLFGRYSAALSSQQLDTQASASSGNGDEKEVTELGLSQSDQVLLGTGGSSSSASTITIPDHLACQGDASAKAWLALATTATSFYPASSGMERTRSSVLL